jgi:hypothetical protein
MKNHSRDEEAQHAAAAAAAAAVEQQLRDEVAHVRGQLCANEEERIAAVDAQARAEMRIAAGNQHRIRQHTSAYVSIRQHTSAYVSPTSRCVLRCGLPQATCRALRY